MPGWQAAMKSWSLQEMADCHRNKRPEVCCVEGGLEGVGCISKKENSRAMPRQGGGVERAGGGMERGKGELCWLCSPADGGDGFQGVSMNQSLLSYTFCRFIVHQLYL